MFCGQPPTPAQATKLSVIVKMLLGEIPERDVFRQPKLERSLRPYFELTQGTQKPYCYELPLSPCHCWPAL